MQAQKSKCWVSKKVLSRGTNHLWIALSSRADVGTHTNLLPTFTITNLFNYIYLRQLLTLAAAAAVGWTFFFHKPTQIFLEWNQDNEREKKVQKRQQTERKNYFRSLANWIACSAVKSTTTSRLVWSAFNLCKLTIWKNERKKNEWEKNLNFLANVFFAVEATFFLFA